MIFRTDVFIIRKRKYGARLGKESNTMKRKWILAFVFAVLMTQPLVFSFQFTDQELAKRGQWEEFLRTAEIERVEKIGEGVTKPRRLYMKDGDIEASGAWKNPTGVQGGVLEGWDYEIAAYLLDKHLELGMIPPTVQRTFRLQKGSLQLWISLDMSELKRRRENIEIPADRLDHVTKMRHLQRAFDSLVANIDRSQQNIRFTPDWQLILIDHSRAFRTKDTYTKRLLYGKDGLKGSFPFEQLPRTFVNKVRALTAYKIKMAFTSNHDFNTIFLLCGFNH